MMRSIVILLLSSGILFPTSVLRAAIPADKIKAAYIYQFTQFVTWPQVSASANEPFTICVLGDEPIGNELEPLNWRQTSGRLTRISSPKTMRDTDSCNILYIAKTEQHQLPEILRYFHNKPVLTISSIPGFAASGGIIGFVIIDNKVRLKINRSAAQRANITLSAKLLEVANVIENHASKSHRP